jgi:hypothetical protein
VARERADQARLLDSRDERAGRQQAMLGVLPADQAFGAAHLGAAHVDDRLIVHDELVALKRALEVADDAQSVHRVVV